MENVIPASALGPFFLSEFEKATKVILSDFELFFNFSSLYEIITLGRQLSVRNILFLEKLVYASTVLGLFLYTHWSSLCVFLLVLEHDT